MKYFVLIIFTVFIHNAFSQTNLPVIEVRGIEFRVVKCEGQKSNSSVKLELLCTNRTEFERRVTFHHLIITDPEGHQYRPLGRGTAYLFGGVGGVYKLKPGMPTRSITILIKDISTRYLSFAQVSVEQGFSGGTEAMDLNNVPIVWR